jgi:hypothetical protein
MLARLHCLLNLHCTRSASLSDRLRPRRKSQLMCKQKEPSSSPYRGTTPTATRLASPSLRVSPLSVLSTLVPKRAQRVPSPPISGSLQRRQQLQLRNPATSQPRNPATTATIATPQHATSQHATSQHATSQHETSQHATSQHETSQHETSQPCNNCNPATRNFATRNPATLG